MPPVAVLVEDEVQIRRFVRTALEKESWHVFEAATIKEGLIEAGTRKPDVVILDLGLPDGDGLDFIHDLRTWSTVPVIVLSARVQETDKIEALDSGADDYLTKPFGMGEFLARVRAVLRRGVGIRPKDAAVLQFGDVEVDQEKRWVRKGNKDVHLTPIEYRLLSMMIANLGRVLTYRQILLEVWGPSYVDQGHYVRFHMAHLRQKLEDDPTRPKLLLTETAIGYRLVA